MDNIGSKGFICRIFCAFSGILLTLLALGICHVLLRGSADAISRLAVGGVIILAAPLIVGFFVEAFLPTAQLPVKHLAIGDERMDAEMDEDMIEAEEPIFHTWNVTPFGRILEVLHQGFAVVLAVSVLALTLDHGVVGMPGLVLLAIATIMTSTFMRQSIAIGMGIGGAGYLCPILGYTHNDETEPEDETSIDAVADPA